MSGRGRPMDAGQASVPLQPTYVGYVSTTLDALVIFEKILRGDFPHVARRPHDRERAELIKSGNIYVFEENASGMKRWTDGNSWSPSRILGNFLIYRELEGSLPVGEKKKTARRPKTTSNPAVKMESGPGAVHGAGRSAEEIKRAEFERNIYGSLIDSYRFKPDGLVKKTISVTVNGITHHMICYHNFADVYENRLRQPTHDPALGGIIPRPDLFLNQSFRAPIEVTDGPNGGPNFYFSGFPTTQGDIAAASNPWGRSMSVPGIPTFGAEDPRNWQYLPHHAVPHQPPQHMQQVHHAQQVQHAQNQLFTPGYSLGLPQDFHSQNAQQNMALTPVQSFNDMRQVSYMGDFQTTTDLEDYQANPFWNPGGHHNGSH